jgi:vanillate O-demethylase monooxygenase subunit
MTNNSKYLHNTWYVAALSTEVHKEQLLRRVFLEIPVVMYRKSDGSIAALHDRCPHRFAPLSMGRLQGDDVVCAYHGLRFDCTGKCNHNPHGNGHIPTKAEVRSFPIMERHGFVWIWMGDQQADPDQLPDYSTLDRGHPNGIGYVYMPFPCHYELITDNVMDLSHVDHLHSEIISTHGKLSPQIPKPQETAGAVAVRWEWTQTPAQLIFKEFMPEPEGEARQFVTVTWNKPTNIELVVGATQDPEAPLNYDAKNVVGQYDLHCCTPEDDNNTHYFFATRRNHKEECAEYNQMKIDGMHGAFANEDGVMLMAVHKEMGTTDFLSLNPVLISSDTGPVRVRRLLAQLIKSENEATG